MANMQNEIYSAMAKNYKTSKEYASVYMETIYGYDNIEAKKVEKKNIPTEVIAKFIDSKKIIEKSNQLASETHMANNPIYNKEFANKMNKSLEKEISHIEHRHKIKNNIQEVYEDEENINTL